MNRAVIDIGSNSVRLLMPNSNTKQISSTQVAEGMVHTGYLKNDAIERTAKAVIEFYNTAMQGGADKVCVFATEAIRSANNRQDFANRLLQENISIHILTPSEEARIGYIGASQGGKASVLDVGGASSELIVGEDDKILYSKSLPIGIVKLKDLCKGQDIAKLKQIVKEKIEEYGNVPESDYLIGIGGTASTIVAVLLGGYDRDKIHNYNLSLEEIVKCLEIISSAKDKSLLPGLCPKRAEVIIPGIIIILEVMEKLGKTTILVSENDNMEGYLSFF